MQAQRVEDLVMIGGDGTLLAAERFSRLGLPCIVVQKTIDNDVAGSEITCMGRTSGFIASMEALPVAQT